ncbi:MAG: hypothetical protein ISQ75_08295 [Puniceicoccaceae bacterium]|jgi:hypothetical protein|nr:hypothetical protein [Puniceicoccaceae bacterium]
MKSRLSLTLDPKVTHRAKRYAQVHNVSLSALVEDLLDKTASEGDLITEPTVKTFSQRWKNSFRPAQRSNERYNRLAEKYDLP